MPTPKDDRHTASIDIIKGVGLDSFISTKPTPDLDSETNTGKRLHG